MNCSLLLYALYRSVALLNLHDSYSGQLLFLNTRAVETDFWLFSCVMFQSKCVKCMITHLQWIWTNLPLLSYVKPFFVHFLSSEFVCPILSNRYFVLMYICVFQVPFQKKHYHLIHLSSGYKENSKWNKWIPTISKSIYKVPESPNSHFPDVSNNWLFSPYPLWYLWTHALILV